MKQYDHYVDAHARARTHLYACESCLFDDGHECGDECSKAAAPYCGCHTCIVREVIEAAYNDLEKHFHYKHMERTIIGAMLCFAAGALFLTAVTYWTTR